MSPEYAAPWAEFLAGRWVERMPDREGVYLVTPRAPEHSDATDHVFGVVTDRVVVYRDPRSGELRALRPYHGWWWSVPVPPLPPPPQWTGQGDSA